MRASSTPAVEAAHTEATWAFLALVVLTAAGVTQRPDEVQRITGGRMSTRQASATGNNVRQLRAVKR